MLPSLAFFRSVYVFWILGLAYATSVDIKFCILRAYKVLEWILLSNMASLTTESFDQDSNTAKNTDAGISVEVLLYGEHLVERALETAMAEVRSNSDDEVT